MKRERKQITITPQDFDAAFKEATHDFVECAEDAGVSQADLMKQGLGIAFVSAAVKTALFKYDDEEGEEDGD